MQFLHKKIDYTVPSGHEGGPMFKQWTPYVGTPYIDMTAAQFRVIQQAIGARLGSTWTLGGGQSALGGNTFQFVRTDATLTLGQVVAIRPPTSTVADSGGGAAATAVTGANTAASPTTTTSICTTNIDNTSFPVPVGVNEDVDNWLYVYSTAGNTAGLPQLRRIKENSSSSTSFYTVAQLDRMRPASPRDADVFDTVPVNGEPVRIIRPFHVIVCTASLAPVGISLGATTAGNYTIIQIGGLANVLIDANGLNEGIVTGIPAWTAAAGAIKGGNGVGTLYRGASCILPQYSDTEDVATGLMVPCYVNFRAA